MSESGDLMATEVLPSDSATIGDASSLETPPALPTQIDRYEIEGQLGSGGMGTVLRGWDAALERPVAIKLLRTSNSKQSQEHRQRLIREAQALAALSHPNVVSVYEVGTHEQSVFVAMELIAGKTLREWTLQEERPWQDILAAFVQAGRGLAAAHAKGIVHRDFKPSNVLVGDDGRTRVLDFGLATLDEDITAESFSVEGAHDYSGDAFADRLTMVGAVVGTPAYMAPEQFDGSVVTAASDQFSYCAAMWEALVGERPFAGSTIGELQEAVLENRRESLPDSAAGVPQRIFAILDRGLRIKPRDRWADMPALLQALERSTSRRGAWVLGVAALGIGSTALVLALTGPSGQRCDGGPDEWKQTWSPATGAEWRGAAESAGAGSLAAASARLDEYGKSWISSYAQVCQEGAAANADPRTSDLRMACLRQRTDGVRGALSVLEHGGPEMHEHAEALVAALPPATSCLEARNSNPATSLPEDPNDAQTVSSLRGRLAAVHPLAAVGRLDEAAEETAAILEGAVAVGFAPLQVEVEAEQGIIASRRGQLDEARRLLERAFWAASDIPYDAVAAKAAIELGWLVGYLQGEHAAGVEWIRHFETMTQRRGRDPTENAGRVLGPIYFEWNKLEQARPYLETSLALAKANPTESHDVGIAHMNLANLYYEQGDATRAEEQFQAAKAILDRFFPDGGPDVLLLDLNYGGLLLDLPGDLTRAEILIERGLESSSKIHGEKHPSTALALGNRAKLRSLQGRHEDALQGFTRALAALEAAGSPSEVLAGRSGRAMALLRAGKLDESEKAWTDVATASRGQLGPDHDLTVFTSYGLGLLAQARGDLDAAHTHYETAVAATPAEPRAESLRIRLARADLLLERGDDAAATQALQALQTWAEASYGADSGQAFAARLHHAVARARTEPARGIPELDRLVASPTVRPNDAMHQAWAKFQLARIIDAEDPERAKTLATEAKAGLTGRAPVHDRLAVSRWLEARAR